MKRLAIINKICYERKNKRLAQVIVDSLRELDADIAFTEYRGHAEEIAKNLRGYGLIIVGGGDGSLSEVINGMDLESQVLAMLPIGTGNSLANDLGIKNLYDSINVIKKNKSCKIDLLKCEIENGSDKFERYIATTSGTGFAEAVVSFGNRYLKTAGPLCYIFSACFKAFLQKVSSAEIKINGSDPEGIKFTSFFINNTKHSANICIFPRANLGDSKLNFSFARTNALTQYLWNIGVLTKTYICHPGERVADKLHISLKRPLSFMLDGEIFDSIKEIGYSVIPRKLTILN